MWFVTQGATVKNRNKTSETNAIIFIFLRKKKGCVKSKNCYRKRLFFLRIQYEMM